MDGMQKVMGNEDYSKPADLYDNGKQAILGSVEPRLHQFETWAPGSNPSSMFNPGQISALRSKFISRPAFLTANIAALNSLPWLDGGLRCDPTHTAPNNAGSGRTDDWLSQPKGDDAFDTHQY